jgi:hypothetical protein
MRPAGFPSFILRAFLHERSCSVDDFLLKQAVPEVNRTASPSPSVIY